MSIIQNITIVHDSFRAETNNPNQL